MKIQGSYTPPMGQSAYSNLKQNISTPANTSVNGNLQAISKNEVSQLYGLSEDRMNAMKDIMNAMEDNVEETIDLVSLVNHTLIDAIQGFNQFKSKQSENHPELDLSKMDIFIEDGQLRLSNVYDINGQKVSEDTTKKLENSLIEDEETAIKIASSLSRISEGVYRMSHVVSDFNREDFEKEKSIRLNEISEEYINYFEAAYSEQAEYYNKNNRIENEHYIKEKIGWQSIHAFIINKSSEIYGGKIVKTIVNTKA